MLFNVRLDASKVKQPPLDAKTPPPKGEGDTPAPKKGPVRPPVKEVGPPPVMPPLTGGMLNSIGMKLVRIPAGKFLMGSSAQDAKRILGEKNRGYALGDVNKDLQNESPQHEVRITRGWVPR